ncbi:MAG: hypothetical protein QOJ99_6199, partial [Bryobacterales bacterium]|nr:hypothetical protein [Bryobacterales bacterium]
YRQFAYISTGEEEWCHDKRIRCESDSRAGDVQHRLIVLPAKDFVIECGQKNFINQLRSQAAAAPVSQKNVLAICYRDGTGESEVFFHIGVEGAR